MTDSIDAELNFLAYVYSDLTDENVIGLSYEFFGPDMASSASFFSNLISQKVIKTSSVLSYMKEDNRKSLIIGDRPKEYVISEIGKQEAEYDWSFDIESIKDDEGILISSK